MTENSISKPKATLLLDEPLENIIADENSVVIFECKLKGLPHSCVWSKDGRPITNCQRTIITSENNWYRLEIRTIKQEDHGLYTINCKNNFDHIISSAILFVAHININMGVSYTQTNRVGTGVKQQLRNVESVKGNIIELEVIFSQDANHIILWFKNNKRVYQNENIIIINSTNSSSLSILQSEITDSGVYSVVSFTVDGIISSFAYVEVADTNKFLVLRKNDILPIFNEFMPEEMETNEGEEIRLICRATVDSNTSVMWLKSGVVINKDNFVKEHYGDQYIGMRGFRVATEDTGEYSVVLRDRNTDNEEFSSTYLTVNPRPTINLPVVEVLRKLDSAVACCGSKVTFDCSFDLSDPKYFYVVWHVGHYRVERTNSRFSVIYNGGEFILFIKQVELGMSGEVVCELRKALPNRKSVYVNRCTSSLTIVPAALKLEISSIKAKLFYKISPPDEELDIANGKNGNKDFQMGETTKTNGKQQEYPAALMEFSYCRLDDEGLFYLNTSNVPNEVVSRVLVDDTQYEAKQKNVVIQWHDTLASTNCWYEIQFGQIDSGYIVAGTSSVPSFEIEAPPISRLLRFRIYTAPVVDNVTESRVLISPTPETVLSQPKEHNLKSLLEFNAKFKKTGDVIGSGAFGSVVLVEDTKGQYYAAKIIKTRTAKKREVAYREFATIRKLRHTKLVELIDAFSEKDVFILVMDYLWGGELFDRIVDEDLIKEVDVIFYVRQICEALQYIHGQKIAHLDLKPENIICLSPNSGQVKIIDFGLAKYLDEGCQVKAIYGTKDYVAPEVLNFESLSLSCDMWSLGVVTYVLLSGIMPFGGDTWSQRSANITRASYNYNDKAFCEVSDLAKDFVDHLLVLKPQKRMSAMESLNHTWIKQGPPKGSKAGHMKRTKENLKSYLANYRERWQRAGNVMIAAHRLRTHAGSQRVCAQKETACKST